MADDARAVRAAKSSTAPGSSSTEFRDEEALDYFELASGRATDPAVRGVGRGVRRRAAARLAPAVGGRGVGRDRPRERGPARPRRLPRRRRPGSSSTTSKARARVLERVEDPTDPWFPCSVTAARDRARPRRVSRRRRRGRPRRGARDVRDRPVRARGVGRVRAAVRRDRLRSRPRCVAHVPDDRTFEVITALRSSAPEGVDRIAELIWDRNPGDARVLALVPRFASKLESVRAMEWSARMRGVGMGRTCPLLARAEDERVERDRAGARVRAGARRVRRPPGARAARAAPRPTSTTTKSSRRCSRCGRSRRRWPTRWWRARRRRRAVRSRSRPSLFERGAPHEAYAVLVHGLSLEAAECLTTDDVVRLLPVPVLEGLAAEAEEHGEEDVAGILEAVAVVAGERLTVQDRQPCSSACRGRSDRRAT